MWRVEVLEATTRIGHMSGDTWRISSTCISALSYRHKLKLKAKYESGILLLRFKRCNQARSKRGQPSA